MTDAALPPPIVILSPGRSFSTVIGAMLGCHPALCVLPETCLLSRDTMEEYVRDLATGATYDGGFFQAVEELIVPRDAPDPHEAAVAWGRERRGATTYAVFDELRAAVAPKILIEKTPSITANVERMRKIDAVFGGRARYIHLTRHPWSYSLSLLRALREATRKRPNDVMLFLKLEDSLCYGIAHEASGAIDGQYTWLLRHQNIEAFLAGIDASRKIRVRGEDFVTEPRDAMSALLSWLELSHEPAVMEKVLHPENWPFSKRGILGVGDTAFYVDPSLKLRKEPLNTLEGPLPWRAGGYGFEPEVKKLATAYGYN